MAFLTSRSDLASRKMKTLPAILLTSLIAGSCGHIPAAPDDGSPGAEMESDSVVRPSPDIQLAAADLSRAAVALADFRKQQPDWRRCFDAALFMEGETLRVVFLQKDSTRTVDGFVVLNTLRCDPGATYIIDRDGKIIRRTYAR